MSQSPKLPESLLKTTPWNTQTGAIWLCTALSLRRNLARYNFPNKLSTQEGDQVIQTIRNRIHQITQVEEPTFYSFKEISPSDQELIFEHFLFLQGFKQPAQQTGIILDKSSTFLTLINIGNHLEIHLLNLDNQIEKGWNKLQQIEHAITEELEFAFSPKFGYLTADPSQSGTGLTVNAYLHLPALIHQKQIKTALINDQDEDVIFMGLSGSIEDPIGDMIIVQNAYSTGISEEAILRAVQTAASKLVAAEKTMRSHLLDEKNIAIKDQISKAFGLILHSFQLETKEAIDLLSLLKLGLALKYIEGVPEQRLNELFFQCRRAHLCHLFPTIKEPTAIAQKRADFLKQELKDLKLIEA